MAIVVILVVWSTIEGDQIYLRLVAIVVILAVWSTIEGDQIYISLWPLL